MSKCNHCSGSGRMVRDPDIGTDQECFVCDGTGIADHDELEQLRQRVAELESASFNDDIIQLELCEKLAASQLDNLRLREIGSSLLSELMEIAVANGANSVSMPDEYVEAAILLCAPSDTEALEAYFQKRFDEVMSVAGTLEHHQAQTGPIAKTGEALAEYKKWKEIK